MKSKKILCLDVGARRVGVALADSSIKIATPLFTADMLDFESGLSEIVKAINDEAIDILVIGMPRNLNGETTAQSEYAREFANNFLSVVDRIEFQDESLTSVQAEKILKSRGGTYSKSDIDMYAASIILQDYLEENF